MAGQPQLFEWIAKHSGEGASLIADMAEQGGNLTFTINMGTPPGDDGDPDG